MAFVQIIEYETDRDEEIRELVARWRAETEGSRTVVRLLHTRDRARPTRYIDIVEFASYEDAMRNSELPQTTKLAEQMVDLCQGPILYADLDVLAEDRA